MKKLLSNPSLFPILAVVLLAGSLTTSAALAENGEVSNHRLDDRAHWALSFGVYDTAAEDERATELGIEYRLRPYKIKGVPLRPAFGIAGTSEGNAWIYGAIAYEWKLGERWVVIPQTGVSLYEEGDGKDLGGPIEFRSGLEVNYRFRGGSRVGLLFYHLSNADIYDHNPGSNSLILKWSFGS